MTRISLAYGRGGLDIDLPADRTLVVEPAYAPAAANQHQEVMRAMREPVTGPPLRDMLRPGATVAISMCDGTRAQPRHIVIPAVLEALEGVIRLKDVVILVATGTHRGNSPEEIREMVGDEVADSVEIINHDARDRDSLVYLGVHGNGVPVWLNRRWVDADIRITTGFVEPHFFAGFSGGPKLVAPGLAGLDTVLTLHNAQRIGDPRATWGICEGNPVHDDVRAVVGAVGKVDFALDVVLNREQAIVQAFGGPVLEMHAEARKLTRKLAMSPVPSLFEVVVTTGSGYPLDQNLYQAVKGISAAATVVRAGGTIVCAAECRDGFPDHGSYREVLASAESPKALFDNISQRAETIPDQWQAQIQASL
jgi:nickel-dependent lactate racemase